MDLKGDKTKMENENTPDYEDTRDSAAEIAVIEHNTKNIKQELKPDLKKRLEKKITQKQRMALYMIGKESVHLKELADKCDINIKTVMGTINGSIAKEKIFIRLGKGFYKLNDEQENGNK